MASAAWRAVAGLRVWAAAATLAGLALTVGCDHYASGPFDPRSIEKPERSAARGETTAPKTSYPTTVDMVPVPQGDINRGERLIGKPFLSTFPTTGRSYTADQVVPMSLREVVTRAVLYNAEMRVAGFEPGINASRVLENEANFDPAVFVNANTARQDPGLSANSNLQANQILGFQDKSLTNSITAGVQQNMISGGRYRFGYQVAWNRLDNLNPAFGQSGTFWQNQILFEVTQPLLRDFGRDVNSARIEIARGDQRISVLDFRRVLEEQLSNIEQSYWQLHQAVRTVEIQEALLIDTLETYRVLYWRWKSGLDASKIPVMQAQSSVEERRADLIDAKRIVRDLSDDLKRRMNDPSFPVTSPLVILPSQEPINQPVNFDLDSAIDSAVANRLELGQQLVRIEQARVAEYVALNNRLPQLNFVGTLGFNGVGTNGTEAIRYGSDLNSPFWNFGLEFVYPLGNRAAISIYNRARLQRLQAIEQYRNLLAQTGFDVKTSINDIYAQWEQVVARKRAREASAEQLSLIQKQQDLGEPITPAFVEVKLRNQETLANNARLEVTALASYNIAIQRLERSKGTLLRYNNISLKEDPGQSYMARAWANGLGSPEQYRSTVFGAMQK
jgi:outer membrane protein TolC